jgi:hypothetical protein
MLAHMDKKMEESHPNGVFYVHCIIHQSGNLLAFFLLRWLTKFLPNFHLMQLLL